MVFAVEEINHSSVLLPGVKLGYRIMDSCDNVHTSLQALFSLISLSKAVTSEVKQTEETESRFTATNKRGFGIEELKSVETGEEQRLYTRLKYAGATVSMPFTVRNTGNYTNDDKTLVLRTTHSETSTCPSGSLVSAVIGLASSSPTRAVAQALGPFNIPLVRVAQEGRIMQKTSAIQPSVHPLCMLTNQ